MRNWVLAGLMVAAMGGWMSLGPADAVEEVARDDSAGEPLFPVVVRTYSAKSLSIPTVTTGVTRFKSFAAVPAETSSTVSEILVTEGERVSKGDVLVRLEVEDRQAKLARAKAAMNSAAVKLQATSKLGREGYRAKVDIAEENSAYASAKADVEIAEVELGRTEIRAPFDGVVTSIHVEVGTSVSPGAAVTSVGDDSSLVTEARVSMAKISGIAPGNTAAIRLRDGRLFDGTVSWVSPKAEETTRTFLFEVEAKEFESFPGDGMAAEISVGSDARKLHEVPRSVLTLSPDGQIGVKIAAEGVARFVPLRIVGDGADGVVVEGLPDEVDLIVRGQGFVRDGDTINVTRE